MLKSQNTLVSQTEGQNWGNAFILAEGGFRTLNSKTAHGLVRGTNRFNIIGVIDSKSCNQTQRPDAGEVLDGTKRFIPIFPNLEKAIMESKDTPQYLILGVATHGGVLPQNFLNIIIEAIKAGISIINGLHDYLSEREDISLLAKKHKVQLWDIRQPKKLKDLHFWTGRIKDIATPRVAVLGVDCNIGKRTTATIVLKKAIQHGLKCELITTGQTGWMQGHTYGFLLDTIPNDFVSGEIEHLIIKCSQEAQPDLIILEGQSALHNPSGPCGSEFILSGQIKHIILQVAPGRQYFDGYEEQYQLPSIEKEIELIEHFGAKVIALSVNSQNLTKEELFQWIENSRISFDIPVLDPFQEEDQKEIVSIIYSHFPNLKK